MIHSTLPQSGYFQYVNWSQAVRVGAAALTKGSILVVRCNNERTHQSARSISEQLRQALLSGVSFTSLQCHTSSERGYGWKAWNTGPEKFKRSRFRSNSDQSQHIQSVFLGNQSVLKNWPDENRSYTTYYSSVISFSPHFKENILVTETTEWCQRVTEKVHVIWDEQSDPLIQGSHVIPGLALRLKAEANCKPS